MRADDVHVSVVSLAGGRAGRAVAVGEQGGGEVSDERKGHENGGAGDPTQLSNSPC